MRRRLAIAFSALLLCIAAGSFALASGASGAARSYDCSTSGCRADVGIFGSSQPNPITPSPSSESEIYIYPKDNGPNSAYGIVVHATVPDGLRIEFARDYGAAEPCTIKGTFVSCYFGNFRREQLGTLVIKVHPRGKQGTFEIPAHVYSQGVDDPNPGNNQVTITVSVYPKGHGS